MLLTVEDMVTAFGEEEMLQIAGEGPRDMRALDRAKIEEALVHASGLAVGYVRDRWPQATDGTPMLKGFAADIARWRLRGRGGQQSAMNDTVQKRYDEAVARLKDIASGRLTLDVPMADGTGPSPASSEQRITASMPPARAAGLLAGYRP